MNAPLRIAVAATLGFLGVVAGCGDGQTDAPTASASAAASAASAAATSAAPPVDPERMKKLLASPTESQRAELVKLGTPAVPYVKRRIQDFILASQRGPKDKRWGHVVSACELIEVLGKIGKPAVPALNELCADLHTMRKLGKEEDTSFRSMKPKICPIVESHGEVCRCKG